MAHSLLRPPSLHVGDAEDHRRPTWLELFYDLVYVATIVELGSKLSDDVSLTGFLGFVALFIPVWWSWVGTTFYSNRFDSDDALHRILVFVQISLVAAMAVNVYDGLGERSIGFAVSYAGVRGILILMYMRAYYFIPEARPLVRRYMIGFGIAAAIWLVSIFFPAPLRFGLWALALAIDFYTPLSAGSRRLQNQLPPSPHHLPERFGLFTIIVLGEGFLKVIGGLAEYGISLNDWVFDFPGIVLSAALWWIYFDNVAEAVVRWGTGWTLVWLYVHLPLHIGLTALGIGLYKAVTADSGELLKDEYRWLICGAVALALAAIALVEWATVERAGDNKGSFELMLRLGGSALALILAAAGGALDPVILMLCLAAIGLVQVVTDFYRRLQSQHQGIIQKV
jgi:low temperature requirement protein LtrA